MFPYAVTQFMDVAAGDAGAVDISGTGWISSLTSASFAGVLNGCMELVPLLLPTVIGFLAFRKAWTFLKSTIAGA